MKKKILWVLVVILLTIGVPAFAKTRTTSVSFIYPNLKVFRLPVITTYSAVGANFRTVSCRNDIGFYSGIDVGIGGVIFARRFSFDPFSLDFGDFSDSSMFLGSLRVPFGKRWAGAGGKFGFYLGGGPELDLLFGEGLMYFAGGFVELGIQTNKTEGVGFHFGYQLGYTPLVLEGGGGLEFSFADPMFFQTSFQFGMSWRRVKN